MRRVTIWWALGFGVLGWITACGRAASSTGSNTNWLRHCGDDSDCPAHAECWCNTCSASCASDTACGHGSCRAPSELGCGAPSSSGSNLCVAVCATNADCARENADFACVNGACLPAEPAGSEGGAPNGGGSALGGATSGEDSSGGNGQGGAAHGGTSGGVVGASGMGGRGAAGARAKGGGGVAGSSGAAGGLAVAGRAGAAGGDGLSGSSSSSAGAGGMPDGPPAPRRLTGLDNRIIEFTEGIQESTPNFIAIGPDGNLWFGDSVTGGGSITPGGVVEHNGANAALGIATAASGNVWEANAASIIEVDPTTGFAVVGGSYGLPQGAQVTSITLGPDGNPWFVDTGRDVVGWVDGIAKTPTEYQLPANSGAFGITTGPDGALWITEATANRIARVTTDGTITDWAIPTAAASAQAITTGPDGALWFIEPAANQIGRVTTAGVFTEFVVPTASSGLAGIAAGSDGAVWFTEGMGDAVGRVTGAGAFTEYVVTNSSPSSSPNGITAGPDGNIWFTDDSFGGFNKLGRLTPENKPFARLNLGFEVTVDDADCRIAQESLIVQNIGDTASGALSVDLDDSNPDRANVDIADHCSGVSLAPGDSCSIDFSHAPDGTGTTAYTLTITVNPTSGDMYSYLAQGC